MKQFILISTTFGDCLLPTDRIAFIRPITDADKLNAFVPSTFSWNGFTYIHAKPYYYKETDASKDLISQAEYERAKEEFVLCVYADYQTVIELEDGSTILSRTSVGWIHLHIQNTK